MQWRGLVDGRRGRPGRSIRWSTVGYAAAALCVVRARKKIALPRPLSTLLAGTVPIAVFHSGPVGKTRAAVTWAAHMWAYKAAFEIPHDAPERQSRRLVVDWPIGVDERIGLGRTPSERLQRRLRRPPQLTPLDRALTTVYALWDVEPHLALAWILHRDPRRFPSAAVRLGATFDLTLVGYWLCPQAPPWWASEREGRMDEVVHRVAPEVLRELRGKQRPAEHYRGANPWAAMPSDHFATALMTAVVLAEHDARAGLAATIYAAALGFALVYLGEHYVVDLLAGGAVAGAVQLATTRRSPLGSCVPARKAD